MKNYSKQREDLLNILKNSSSHPTAEELYEKTKEKIKHYVEEAIYKELADLRK